MEGMSTMLTDVREVCARCIVSPPKEKLIGLDGGVEKFPLVGGTVVVVPRLN
jgi:hypothetical protein